MARTLTLERDCLRQQVIVLRKMGWMQEEISETVGVPQQTISYWLSHDIRRPSMAKGQAILCHSIGWEDEKIGEAIGVAPSIVRRWVGQNTTQHSTFTNNSKHYERG